MKSKGVSAAEYERAFAKLLPTMHERKKHFLRIMMGLPNQTASSRFLLARLNVSHDIVVNQTIGQLGNQVFRIIGVHPEAQKKPFQTWTVIAEMGEAVDEGYPWKLRPAVVSALRSLGFEEEFTSGEELLPRRYWEGAVAQRTVNVYERSLEARQACIAQRGHACAVCSFDFGATYGSLMLGFIHIHHLKALSDITERYEVDPETDLIPVCPNCHAAIHFGGVTRSIEEVQGLIAKHKHC